MSTILPYLNTEIDKLQLLRIKSVILGNNKDLSKNLNN